MIRLLVLGSDGYVSTKDLSLLPSCGKTTYIQALTGKTTSTSAMEQFGMDYVETSVKLPDNSMITVQVFSVDSIELVVLGHQAIPVEEQRWVLSRRAIRWSNYLIRSQYI